MCVYECGGDDGGLRLLLQRAQLLQARVEEDQERGVRLVIVPLRRVLHNQCRNGNLPWHEHRKLEEDLRELDLVVGGCERLFSSPVPPTMSRHSVRCLIIWLFSLPFVLAGTMAPFTCAMCALARTCAHARVRGRPGVLRVGLG